MKKILIVIAVLVGLFMLAGCQQTTAEVEAQFCTDLAVFDAALAELESLPDSATVDEVAVAQEALKDAWGNLLESGQVITDLRLDGVESTLANLQNRIDEAPSQPNVSEAVITVKQAAEGVRRAIDEVFSTVDCE